MLIIFDVTKTYIMSANRNISHNIGHISKVFQPILTARVANFQNYAPIHLGKKSNYVRAHSFSTYTKFSEKITFLWKISRTY